MSADVLAERARVQSQIEGKTLADTLAETVRQRGDEPAYSDKHHAPEGESWRTLTWSQTQELARDVAAALIELGLQPGQTVAIMATNRIEHYVADIGAMLAAATPMSIYNTLSPEQVAYVAGHARPAVVILENADHRGRWEKAIAEVDGVQKVVMLDEDWDAFVAAGAAYRAANPEAVAERTAQITPDSPATILYTSGTTEIQKEIIGRSLGI